MLAQILDYKEKMENGVIYLRTLTTKNKHQVRKIKKCVEMSPTKNISTSKSTDIATVSRQLN